MRHGHDRAAMGADYLVQPVLLRQFQQRVGFFGRTEPQLFLSPQGPNKAVNKSTVDRPRRAMPKHDGKIGSCGCQRDLGRVVGCPKEAAQRAIAHVLNGFRRAGDAARSQVNNTPDPVFELGETLCHCPKSN